MVYTVEWSINPETGGCHERQVFTGGELDELLDRIERDRGQGASPVVVTLYRPDEDSAGLQIGIGHPYRGFALMIEHGGGYAHQLDLPEFLGPVDFDYNGQLTSYRPDQLRITPAEARNAAGKYLSTGQRPTNLLWNHATAA